MTIAPLPPNPALLRLPTGPLDAPAPAADGEGFGDVLRALADDAGDRRFGGTMLRTSVERFNENGFFTDAGSLAASNPAIGVSLPVIGPPTETSGNPDTPTASDIGSSTAASLPNLRVLEDSAARPLPAVETMVTAPDERLTPPVASSVAKLPVEGVNLSPEFTPVAAALPLTKPVAAKVAAAMMPETAPTNETTKFTAPAKARPAQSEAARSPISVTVDTGDGAAAVTVAAHGLNDREAEALRVDIAALLRRHGLVLDDVRINGRPTGQGQNKSGG